MQKLFYLAALYAFECHLNRIDISVGIERHFIDTGCTMIAAFISQRTAMVDNVVIFRSRYVHDGMVTFPIVLTLLAVVLLGALLGLIASWFSVHRHIRDIEPS